MLHSEPYLNLVAFVVDEAHCVKKWLGLAQLILEETDDVQGQEAILCEGSCNSWYHRWCAGVSTQRYEALSRSEDPFHCPTCAVELQQQSILELQSSIRTLTKEVH